MKQRQLIFKNTQENILHKKKKGREKVKEKLKNGWIEPSIESGKMKRKRILIT